jgi:hypothetical protein
MGLEPTTFCMAKAGEGSGPFARVRPNLLFAAASGQASERQRPSSGRGTSPVRGPHAARRGAKPARDLLVTATASSPPSSCASADRILANASVSNEPADGAHLSPRPGEVRIRPGTRGELGVQLDGAPKIGGDRCDGRATEQGERRPASTLLQQ